MLLNSVIALSLCFRLVGGFTLILQGLIQDGELKLCESLIDSNNKIMEVKLLLKINEIKDTT